MGSSSSKSSSKAFSRKRNILRNITKEHIEHHYLGTVQRQLQHLGKLLKFESIQI